MGKYILGCAVKQHANIGTNCEVIKFHLHTTQPLMTHCLFLYLKHLDKLIHNFQIHIIYKYY